MIDEVAKDAADILDMYTKDHYSVQLDEAAYQLGMPHPQRNVKLYAILKRAAGELPKVKLPDPTRNRFQIYNSVVGSVLMNKEISEIKAQTIAWQICEELKNKKLI